MGCKQVKEWHQFFSQGLKKKKKLNVKNKS